MCEVITEFGGIDDRMERFLKNILSITNRDDLIFIAEISGILVDRNLSDIELIDYLVEELS